MASIGVYSIPSLSIWTPNFEIYRTPNSVQFRLSLKSNNFASEEVIQLRKTIKIITRGFILFGGSMKNELIIKI